MRRVCGTLVCALPLLLLAVPAHASDALLEREALRAVLSPSAATAASRAQLRLPLPTVGAGQARASSVSAVPASIAANAHAQRVLVGARAHADVPRLRSQLERSGAHVCGVDALGVLVATVPSGAQLVRALRGEPGVAHVERDRSLRGSAEPFDVPDPEHANIRFTWAYDEVRAAWAIAAAGGGSRRTVAIIDTGLDVGHPDLAAHVGRSYDSSGGGSDVSDSDGHGTFVAGLVAAEDGNGIGTKGVAGATKVLPVRASIDGAFALSDVVRGLAWAVRHGADVVNLSLAGDGLDRTSARALDFAFFADVLPVAASGNQAENGNPLQFPAAFLGGRRGRRGIGLSVAASEPGGSIASFSNHNDYVTVAAPGASDSCSKGVFSTIPRQGGTQWDMLSPCASSLYAGAGGRWAYAQGTSFATPIASGIAALVWQVEPRLKSEQVADVIRRSARQTLPGTRWNEFSGTGVVDGEQAVALARTYDLRAPQAHARATRRGRAGVSIAVSRSRDRTSPGRELAGRVRYALLVSHDGGKSFDYAVRPRSSPLVRRFALRGTRTTSFIASVCDRNGNCGVKRLGRFRRR